MKDVLISLKGFSNDEQQLEFITEGQYYKQDGHYCVTYEETEITGMEGTKTTLFVKDKSVSLIRNGTINSSLFFEEGMQNTSTYETEYGVFTVELKTDKIMIDINEEGGSIVMDYNLGVSGKENANNKFSMTIKEVTNNEYNQ